jgi:hypothetical protein
MLFHIGFDSNETSLRICPVRHPTAVADSTPKIQPTQPTVDHCSRSAPVSALPLLFGDTADEARAFVAARPCRVVSEPARPSCEQSIHSATSEPGNARNQPRKVLFILASLTMTTTTSITILSTSAASARRAIKILADWVPLKSLSEEAAAPSTAAATARSFHHIIPWSLITTQCLDNDVRIQWLAPEYSATSAPPPARHSLLAITQASSTIHDDDPARAVLAPFAETLSPTKLRACHFFRRPVQASYLLGPASRFLPVMQIHQHHEPEGFHDNGAGTHAAPPPPRRSGLKEVVIPYDDDTYEDSTTSRPFQQLMHLSSPATGLYLLPRSNLCVRPLPTGFHDRHLPPPSLVFHSPQALPWPVVDSRDDTVTIRKIGHSGLSTGAARSSSGGGGGSGGQYRFDSADLAGLDVRLCSSETYQSMFAEAHESLLAGSIDKLQSTRVLGAGARDVDDDDAEEIRRKNSSDCWMEFRATVRNPMGFFQRPAGKRTTRTAKVPDLPYE